MGYLGRIVWRSIGGLKLPAILLGALSIIRLIKEHALIEFRGFAEQIFDYYLKIIHEPVHWAAQHMHIYDPPGWAIDTLVILIFISTLWNKTILTHGDLLPPSTMETPYDPQVEAVMADARARMNTPGIKVLSAIMQIITLPLYPIAVVVIFLASTLDLIRGKNVASNKLLLTTFAVQIALTAAVVAFALTVGTYVP